ncbi:hypothetical protein [Acinetobacter sp. 'aerobic (ED)']|uniref:hypothetical protein n=1 Tax=Acinetobacter sp. 'aerobic (ED)' TaxID=174230 RepID=UPI00192C42B0|nr:hypothetical protein [Acinetobacter sp. 'aerobic (ED)']
MTNTTLELGIIPKGTMVKINGMPFILQDDVPVAADQEIVDLAIKNQTDFYNGVGVVGWGREDCLRELKTGNCQIHGENDGINGNLECKASKPR